MSITRILGLALNVVTSLEKDDNGHPYRNDDGGWIPNNEYELDGTIYATDDNGSIYSVDGQYYPDDYFELEGIPFSTDEEGNLIE